MRVVTDGRFDEWGGAALVLDDPEDAPEDAALDQHRRLGRRALVIRGIAPLEATLAGIIRHFHEIDGHSAT